MILLEETKSCIYNEYNAFKEKMYAGKSLEQRKELDQFFTPPEITIPMIEKFDCDSLAGKNILDPTSGSGNLLVACLIAGADPDKLYGNDYDGTMVKVCRERIKNVCKQLNLEGFKDYQIHRGNALQKRCLNDFSTYYENMYRVEYIDDLDYAQGKYNSWEQENKQAKLRHDQQNQTEEELW